MDVGLLRAFVAVAEEQHFGRAARRLFVSAPALSQRIKKLEAQAGTRLVERSPVTLTPAGAALLVMARRTVATADATAAHLAALHAGRGGELRVGVLSHGGGEVMAAAMRSFSEHLPEVAVTVRALDFPEAASAVKERDVDVAFVRPSLGDARLREYPVFTERRYAILPRWDERACLDEVRVTDIDRDRFLTPADGSPTAYRSFLHLLRERNDEPPRTVDSQCRRAEEFLSAVASGRGIATTIRSFTRHYRWPDIAYVPIRDAAPATTALVVDAADRRAVVRAFVDRLCAVRAQACSSSLPV
jgi:DNA-binding transcriptional LysR family regulator